MNRLLSSYSDRDLIRRVVAGRRDAYLALVRRHFPTAYARAYAQLGGRAEAARAAAETFVFAYRMLDRLAPGETFEQRVTAILRDLCRDPAAGPSAVVNDTDASRALRRRLMDLDPSARLLLLLRHYARLGPAAVAEACDLPLPDVRQRLAEAEAQLGRAALKALPEAVAPPLSAEDVARRALEEPVVWRVPAPEPEARKHIPLVAAFLLIGLVACAALSALALIPAQKAPEAVAVVETAPPASVSAPPKPEAHAQEPMSASLSEGGSLDGRVVDAATGEPVRNFEVAHPDDTAASGTAIFVATTTSDGRFHLARLEPGTVEVRVRAEGYLEESVEVAVPEDRPAETTVRLRRALTVEGTVVDEAGNPVAGALLFAGGIPFPALDGREDARSDAEGRFRIEAMPPEAHDVYAYHPDHAPVAAAAAPGTPLRLALPPAGRIDATLHAGSDPLVTAELVAIPAEGGGVAVRGYTDADGRCVLSAVPTGPVDVTAAWADTRSVARRIDVRPGETVPLELAFTPASSRLEGVVTVKGEPVRHAQVEVRVTTEAGDEFTAVADVSFHGWYRVGNVPPGRAVLRTMAATPDSRLRRKAVSLTVPSNEVVRRDLDFTATASLRGAVEGLPPGRHARVYALLDDLDRRPANLRQLEELTRTAVARRFMRGNGPFHFDALEPGEYVLYAIALDDESPQDFADAPVATTRVTLDPHASATLRF